MSGGDVAGISRPTSGEHAAGFDLPVDPRTAFAVGLAVAPTVERPTPAPAPAVRLGLPASVIHELRTPLTSIHGYAQVLKRALRQEPKASNAVTVLNRESARLSDMLALLSELSDLESDEPAPERELVQLDDIVGSVARDVARREDRIQDLALVGDARAHTNAALVAQALTHVLTNAMRYSEPGQTITIEVRTNGNAAQILVHDDGIGILAEDRERVFAPFERGTNAREHGVRGLGLGLYLARRALVRCGGNIEIPRDGARGTTVLLTLPAA